MQESLINGVFHYPILRIKPQKKAALNGCFLSQSLNRLEPVAQLSIVIPAIETKGRICIWIQKDAIKLVLW